MSRLRTPGRPRSPASGPPLLADPRPVQTSLTNPLRVDFVPAEVLGVPGRLGMTICPGKRNPHGLRGNHARDLELDLARLRETYGVEVLVTLMEFDEIKRIVGPAFFERVVAHGLAARAYPIRDVDVPVDLAEFIHVVRIVVHDLRAGRTVVVHCLGGHGRTGLAVACVLTMLGMEPTAAIAATRAARPGTLETPEQARWVWGFAERLAESDRLAARPEHASRDAASSSGRPR